jgi:hypothetical protein
MPSDAARPLPQLVEPLEKIAIDPIRVPQAIGTDRVRGLG